MITKIDNKTLVLDQSINLIINNFNSKDIDNKKIFITGGTGYVGIWILSAIRALNNFSKNINVCVLSRDPESFQKKHPQFSNQKWLSFITGDIKNFNHPRNEFDYLIHGATETSKFSHANPEKMLDDIFFGTKNIINFAEKVKLKKILMISSGAVYGNQPANIANQSDESENACRTCIPQSAYGEGKRIMELMGTILQDRTGIQSTSARCFSFSGPGIPLDGHYAYGNFIRDALFGNSLNIYGNGCDRRSYLNGSDLAIWLLKLLIDGKSGEIYNVGSDQGISIKDLATTIRDTLAPGKDVNILNIATSGQSISKNYVPSIEKAKTIGCSQWTTLKESILQTARYWQ